MTKESNSLKNKHQGIKRLKDHDQTCDVKRMWSFYAIAQDTLINKVLNVSTQKRDEIYN